MVKIRVYFDDEREIREMIKLLSPRLNYCKTFPEEKKAYLGIETNDLLVELESGEEAPIKEGGNENAQ